MLVGELIALFVLNERSLFSGVGEGERSAVKQLQFFSHIVS
jgi:hypothetical protein